MELYSVLTIYSETIFYTPNNSVKQTLFYVMYSHSLVSCDGQ